MRSLVVYYSLKGKTKGVAEYIAKELKADMERIEPLHPINGEKFMSFYGDRDEFGNDTRTDISPPKHDWKKYDLIVVGTPIWAWAPAPPVHLYLKREGIKGKKVAIFSTSDGDSRDALTKMKGQFAGNSVIAQKEFISRDVIEYKISKKKAVAWSRNLKKNHP